MSHATLKKINPKRLAPHSEGGRKIDLQDWEALVKLVKELAENQNAIIERLRET